MPAPAPRAIEAITSGVRLRVLVQPRSSVTALAGLHEDRVRIRLAVPPVDGAANAALIDFLAMKLRCPKSALCITAGQAGRRKSVSVQGVSLEQVRRALDLDAMA